MTYETLRLAPTANADSSQPLAEVLKGVEGVRGVALAPASKELEISFDADLTSAEELTTVLARAGYAVQSPRGNGSCCG